MRVFFCLVLCSKSLTLWRMKTFSLVSPSQKVQMLAFIRWLSKQAANKTCDKQHPLYLTVPVLRGVCLNRKHKFRRGFVVSDAIILIVLGNPYPSIAHLVPQVIGSVTRGLSHSHGPLKNLFLQTLFLLSVTTVFDFFGLFWEWTFWILGRLHFFATSLATTFASMNKPSKVYFF